jgi:hypothetical protein
MRVVANLPNRGTEEIVTDLALHVIGREDSLDVSLGANENSKKAVEDPGGIAQRE